MLELFWCHPKTPHTQKSETAENQIKIKERIPKFYKSGKLPFCLKYSQFFFSLKDRIYSTQSFKITEIKALNDQQYLVNDPLNKKHVLNVSWIIPECKFLWLHCLSLILTMNMNLKRFFFFQAGPTPESKQWQ